MNTAADEVPEIPFLSTFLGCAVRFDSGLRHDYKMREMLIFQCFSYFSLLNILITLLFSSAQIAKNNEQGIFYYGLAGLLSERSMSKVLIIIVLDFESTDCCRM